MKHTGETAFAEPGIDMAGIYLSLGNDHRPPAHLFREDILQDGLL